MADEPKKWRAQLVECFVDVGRRLDAVCVFVALVIGCVCGRDRDGRLDGP